MTSKLKVNLINDSGDNNIITSDGSGVITSSKFKIGQVLSSETTSSTSTTSSSFSDTGITLAITPSSTSSKIYVTIQLAFMLYGGGTSLNATGRLKLVSTVGGSSTDLFTTSQNPTFEDFDENQDSFVLNYPINYLHTSNTTSEVTYKLQFACTAGSFTAQVYSNRSSITLMEVLP